LTTEENAATSSDANSPEEDHRKEKEDIKEKKEEERKGERISIDSSEDSMPVLMHPIVSQKLSKDKDKDKERKDDRDSDPSKVIPPLPSPFISSPPLSNWAVFHIEKITKGQG